MLRRLTRVLITLLCTALLLSVCATTAEAKGRKGKSLKVFGVTRAGQDWYHGRMLVKWRPVRGASYQMRVSWTPSQLSRARVIPARSSSSYTGTLDRGKAWYVQVRAIRGGAVGPWSRARGLKFVNTWPKATTVRARSLPGAVQFDWNYSANASRYRVRWSPAWYGAWPSAATFVDRSSGGWVNQYARKSVFHVPSRPTAGDNYLAVDYANPVFGQVEASNGYRSGASARSKWVPVFPAPTAPQAGDAVRMGTYNVMLYPTGTRAAAIASNINDHGVTVVALQEASQTTANAVVAALGSAWRSSPSGNGAGQQILFRSDKFRLLNSGSFGVPNPKTPSSPLATPWARLTSVASGSQPFYVVSAHFSEDANKSPVQKNRDTGLAAQATMREMNSVNSSGAPVIVAGDIRYGREPYGDPAGYTAAHPTFVRGGYYDAMASLKKYGYQYSSVNGVKHQTPHPSGLGPRSDHILVKGFKGSFSYANVYNWSKNGSIPSDHNLIYADLAIPRGPRS